MHGRQAVTLRGMRFHALIGVLPHETDVAQPVEVDLTVWRAARKPGELIDYRALYDLTARTLGSGHIAYLEDVADRLMAAALALPGVVGATVAVRKPHVALPGPLAYAEVVLDRAPDDDGVAPPRRRAPQKRGRHARRGPKRRRETHGD